MKASHAAHKNIAVVIPCYNEASGISQVISKFPREKLAHEGYTLSIYVVDNNSTDDTASVAAAAGAIVIHEPQKGKGHALRAGFRALPATIDYVVMLDGDDTYSPEEILRMIEPLECDFCDVVVGSRLGGNIQQAAMRTFNRLGNWVFTNAVRTIYHANVTDVLTGYFAWKKPALDKLYPLLNSEGFAIEMEMVTKMSRLGMRLVSVPISYHPRSGESNLQPLGDGMRIMGMLLRNITWRRPTGSQYAASQPQRIVFVSDGVYPYMKGGKEKRLYELSTRLVSMGYDVHIYTMKWWDEPSDTHIVDGVTMHAICNYHRMYVRNRRSIAEGIIFGLSCLKLLRVRFDVLDVDHMPFFPILSLWMVCTLRRRKFFGTWHEALSKKDWLDYMGPSGIIASAIERLSVRLPHVITAASAHTKDLLASVHGRAQGVSLVASGIDAKLIKSVKPADTNCDVLYVGRLVRHKNIDVLLEAVAILASKKPDFKALIIGDGPERPNLEAWAITQGLEHTITFLDPLSSAAEVYAYMKAAKSFCLPSSREGFSIATLEALGCGTPVVTSDIPANAARHLIQHGKNGHIVPCQPEALAEAIQQWTSANNKPDIAKMVAQYDWQQLAHKQIKVYTS